MDRPSQHCQSTEWSLHCSMLPLRLKDRWTPLEHCQSTDWSLHCSMLSFRLKGRWTPQSTWSQHRVISSLFNVVIETQRQMDPPSTLSEHRVISSLFNVVIETQRTDWTPLVNTVRAQSDLFTVQCCHSESKADWPPWSTLSEHKVISLQFNVVIETQRQTDTPQSTLSEHRVISSLFNVVIQTQRQRDPPGQHCQSTEWSLHCSMLSLRLKGRWTPSVQNTARAQSDLFTVQCCHWDSKADGPPLVNIVRAQSYLFTVQCCHSDSNTDGPPSQTCQSTQWSLHC